MSYFCCFARTIIMEVIRMLEEIIQLRRLVEEANVQTNVLAQLCHCHPSSIYKYIRGNSIPTGAHIMAIREGLQKYKEMINNIIKN